MNFYEKLGIPSNADDQQIKNAFRKIAKTIHPDYNKKDSAFYEMVELNLIHDTLLNTQKRHAYDQSLISQTSGDQLSKIYHSKSHPFTWFRLVKSVFSYRCKTCGIEMSSTWKGYCLLHYLEASGQLHNDDHTFIYNGYRFYWQDPPSTKTNPQKTDISISSVLGYLFITIVIFCIFVYFGIRIASYF